MERHPLGVPNITLPRVWDAGTNSIQAVSLVRRRFHLIPVILATVVNRRPTVTPDHIVVSL